MSTKRNPTTAATSMEPPGTRPPRLRNARLVQNFLLVWLDESIDETNNEECCHYIRKLRQIVNNVNTFTNVDECVDFINSIKDEKIFIISSGVFGERTVPMVHDKQQISTIYIFNGNKSRQEQWTQQWPKVKGIFTDITPICEALKTAAQDCDQNAVSISLVKKTDGATSQNLDALDPSFMYTQILKEILLTINFEQRHITEFLTYCREQFSGNTIELKNIDKLEKEYRRHQPIWWYTYDCFLYSMLNCALRTLEADLIIKMGFFVQDLHKHIAALHSEQYAGQNHLNTFVVYRGQGFSPIDFEQVINTKGGLLSFNNFLSTSKIRDVSLNFARHTTTTSSLVGVLFVMTIDPSISSTPFADVCDVSTYQTEEEILFSMHSVFRIGQIKQIDTNDRLWQVDLTLTGDSDPQLRALTEQMREETFLGCEGWYRLGELLIKLGQFNKAKEVYEVLLSQTSNDSEIAYICCQMGYATDGQGNYEEAITLYEKAIDIYETRSPNDHALANSYNNIGEVYRNMGEYKKALSYYEKALEIRQKTLPPNHPDSATSYNNIGLVYDKIGEYKKALSYYEKAHEIKQKTLPINHPSLATSYNNIGAVHYNMRDYSKALLYYEKVLEIYEITLPANHPSLATCYNNIGLVYDNMGEYMKALSSHEKALEIRQKTLPVNHPDSATSYACHGSVYEKMGEHSKALSYYGKALEIYQKTLPAHHPLLTTSYNNIGAVYYNMCDYSKALLYYEKALEIQQKALSEDHLDLATSYACHGSVYHKLGQYSKALTYFERALDIKQRLLPPDHPSIKNMKESIETVKKRL